MDSEDHHSVKQGFKKVFSRPVRSSISVETADSDRPSTAASGLRSSLDSSSSNNLNADSSNGGLPREESNKSLKAGLAKLMPKKSRRRRRLSTASTNENEDESSQSTPPPGTVILAPGGNASLATLDNSLLTDESDAE